MKPRLRSLRLGERVWALVEECLLQEQVIINFGGDLIRVSNESHRIFRAGQRVLLEVMALRPLQFKLVTRSHLELSRRPLDVTI